MYRTIQTDMWSDPELEEWSFEEKAFYIYLITSPHTTIAGFVKKAIRHMAVDTGLSPERVQELLETLAEREKIVVTSRWVWIRNFLRYQNMKGDAWKSIVKELLNLLSPETLPMIEYITHTYSNEMKQISDFNMLNDQIAKLRETVMDDIIDTSDNPRLTPGQPPVNPRYPTGVPSETVSESVSVSGTVLSTLSTIARSSKKQEERVSTQSVDAPSSESDSCKNLQEDAPLRDTSDSTEDLYDTENPIKIDAPPSNRTPYQKIIEIYHEECPDLPRVKVLNETRKRFLRARWREHPDLEWWREYFRRVHKSDFLCGRVESRNGSPPFRADFEWLIRPNNMAKVIEGRYDNRDPSDAYIREIAREMGIQLKEG